MDHWRPEGGRSRSQHAEDPDTSYYYYPPANMGPFLSSSVEQRAAPKPKRPSCFNRTLPFIGVVILIAIIVVVAVCVHGGNSSDTSTTDASASTNSTSSSTGSSSSGGSSALLAPPSSSSSGASSSCPEVAASNRTVVFWQSEVAGCDLLPSGVTHVVWGFALVADGAIVPTFQGADATLAACVQTLRARCIRSIGGVGGATNNANMSAVVDADAFAQSAAKLVQKFDFDGLDLDDETVGAQFNASRVVDVLRATRSALDALGSDLVLTYDAYFFEGQPSFCESAEHAAYTRCFPAGVLAYVDWVNIMSYNAAEDESAAEAVYAAALATTFADWQTQLGGDFSRATIGVCVDSNCAFGPGPNATIIEQWEQFARRSSSDASTGGGGMMVYAASGEVVDDFPLTRSVIA